MFSHDCDEYVGETGIVGRRGKDRTGKAWFNHMPAQAIKDQIGAVVWNDYFKFCVVRNPFDKLVSAFHFFEWKFEQHKDNPRKNRFPRIKRLGEKGETFLDAIQNKSDVERFRLWVAWGGGLCDRNKYMIGDEFCMDFFIRFESLQDDIHQVCDTLGMPFEPDNIMRLKSGTRPRQFALSEYYDAKTIERVSQEYDLEIQHFGYHPPE